jgi:putative oxidoreductase
MTEQTRKQLTNIGLLLLRVGVGAAFIYLHGYAKITGGVEAWTNYGKMGMEPLGITWGYPFWGFCAAFAESVGALLLVLGVLFRPAAFLLAFTMAAAGAMHLKAGQTNAAEYPLVIGFVFLCLILIGPGDYALGRFMRWNAPKK